MTNQTMPRSEWVLSQLLTWQNVVSSIAIFLIQDVTPASCFFAGFVPGASQPAFSARRHHHSDPDGCYSGGTGILISTVIYFISVIRKTAHDNKTIMDSPSFMIPKF